MTIDSTLESLERELQKEIQSLDKKSLENKHKEISQKVLNSFLEYEFRSEDSLRMIMRRGMVGCACFEDLIGYAMAIDGMPGNEIMDTVRSLNRLRNNAVAVMENYLKKRTEHKHFKLDAATIDAIDALEEEDE